MTKITVRTDCGNSPKMELIKQINIAFAEGDIDFILDHMSDDEPIWDLIGEKTVVGKDAIRKEFNEMDDSEAEELIIDAVLSHGNLGAANGAFRFRDGTELHFNDIYKFDGFGPDAKIKVLISYAIEI